MKAKGAALLLAACLSLLAAPAFSQGAAERGSKNQDILRVDVRPGVRLPCFVRWRENAVATLVMFSGGGGGFGRIDPATGWPASHNFLIRTAPTFQADRPFNIVLVGRASDTEHLGYPERVSEQHLNDNLALLRSVRQHSSAPIWVIGTSRGTVSAGSLAIHDPDHLIAGLVLTSSIIDSKTRGSVPTQDIDKISVPTLVVHHEHDACKVCPPSNVSWLMRGLNHAPVKAALIVSGGEDQALGDPCESSHTHGYIGIEQLVVDSIANWILNPRAL